MTDKEQIIHNGINVRKCPNLNKKDKVTCCEYYRTKCYEVSDCLFKQRARKTQECEEQENKIKKLRKNLALEIESNTRYRKALEEIEAATKINCEEICGRKFEDCNDTSCFSAELLDIINKAKGEK